MKRLIKLGFALLCFSFVTSQLMASFVPPVYSPLWDSIPDMYVCQSDYTFDDAINIFNYVNDEDTPRTSLIIAYAEGPWDNAESRSDQVMDGLASNEFTVNSKSEIDYTGVSDTMLPNNSLLQDGSTYLTTTADGYLTYEGTANSDRAAVYIASDGVTSPSVSKVFRVRFDDGGCIYSNPTLYPLKSYMSENDFSTWGFTSMSTPTSGVSADALSISTSKETDSDFAWWQLQRSSTDIPLSYTMGNMFYRCRFNIQSSEKPADWVTVQMRVFAADNAENAKLNVSANGYVPDANTSHTYDLFYQPSSHIKSDNLLAGFYVVDSDPLRGGTYTLNSVEVDAIDDLGDVYAMEKIFYGGASIIDLNFSDEITGTDDSGLFSWSAYSANAPAFAIAQLNTGIDFSPNRLYKIGFLMGGGNSSALESMPTFRLRMFDESNSIVSEIELVAQGPDNSYHMPDSMHRWFSVYLSSEGVEGNELRCSFDLINSDPTKSGQISWERAHVLSVDFDKIP